jgi:subtilisin family serine protease
MKTADSSGAMYDSDIISAINVAISHSQIAGKRGVINMSLGGSCSSDNCQNDVLIKAVNAAVGQGMVVAVAAGNSYCNVASPDVGSPGSAWSAITVGAIDPNDKMAYFSNFGQNIDIMAPGQVIYAACSKTDITGSCSGGNYFMKGAGTSAATPVVSGVAAMLLQKSPTAQPSQVLRAMQCDAQKNILTMPSFDTVTKNLFLQVPKNDGVFGTCNLGAGCTSSCSGRGLCAPAHVSAAYGSTDSQCFCDGGYGGPSCATNMTALQASMCATGHTVTMSMGSGDGK